MLARTGHDNLGFLPQAHNDKNIFDEITMEVAAYAQQPFPAHYMHGNTNTSGGNKNKLEDSITQKAKDKQQQQQRKGNGTKLAR